MTDLDTAYAAHAAHVNACPVCWLPTLQCEGGKTLHRAWHVAAGAGADLLDGDASKPYTVAWKDVNTGEWFVRSYVHARDAMGTVRNAQLYANLELLAYTTNLDEIEWRV
ncbi:hypothetical protein [Kitasatospora purpeofusca]|uniref:hypothetical protein n=1 Tax=Kitasatospora purpeofusca TaxID=67352 RepID=UPI0036CB4410